MENTRSRKEYNAQRKQGVEDKKLEIIDAAQKLILADGLGNVTMGQIMKETQTSRATMYRYFPSIHPIVFEIQYRMMNEIFGDWKNAELESLMPNVIVYKIVNILIDNFHKHVDAYNYISMFSHFYADVYPDETLSNNYMYYLERLFFGETPSKKETIEKYLDLITSAEVIFSYLQNLAHRKITQSDSSGYTYELSILKTMTDKVFLGK